MVRVLHQGRLIASGLGWMMLVFLNGCQPTPATTLPGHVEGEYVRVAAAEAGQVIHLAVSRGDRVGVGDPLFDLERERETAILEEANQRLARAEALWQNLRKGQRPEQLEALAAQRRQAEAASTLSQQELARRQKLFQEHAVSAASLDEAKAAQLRDQARVEELDAQQRLARSGARSDEIAAAEAEAAAARATVEQAGWQLRQKQVMAPVAGQVQDTLYLPGEWVSAGAPVVVILPPGNIKARFYVAQPLLGGLRIGRSVQVGCDGCPRPLGGEIRFIASQAEYTPPVIYSKDQRAKLVYLVEVRFPPAIGIQLHPGQPMDWLDPPGETP